MGYAYGQNNNGREIGYGVEATCDLDGCEARIDRGMAYVCGGVDGTGNAGMEDEPYCGGYFCEAHLHFLPTLDGDDSVQVCVTCYERQKCPACGGSGSHPPVDLTDDDYPCNVCDSHGHVAQRAGEPVDAL